MKKAMLLVLLLLMASLVSGMYPTHQGIPCRYGWDCPWGLWCSHFKCYYPLIKQNGEICREDNDCERFLICRSGKCFKKGKRPQDIESALSKTKRQSIWSTICQRFRFRCQK